MSQSHAANPDDAARLQAATDAFIGDALPAWLRRASAAQINRLRDRFAQHQASQRRVRAATLDLIPLQAFAQQRLITLLRDGASSQVKLEDLQWLEVRREFGRLPGVHWPFYRPVTVREPGLLRLMQNFSEGDELLAGSGLVAAGSDTLLSDTPSALANACRALDVGSQYQRQLQQVFDAATCASLADDKRAGLSLAAEIAALKGQLSAYEQIALDEVARGHRDANEQGLRGYPGLLSLLGCTTNGAMVILLRDSEGQAQGLVLYLPSDPERAIERFADWHTLAVTLVQRLREPVYRERFSRLIALRERPAFLQLLATRLSDPRPDLALEGVTPEGDVFVQWVHRQVQCIHDDARLLLVPTADADRTGRVQRLQAWTSAGLGLVNLAGLFIPGVGELLLGLLAAQTLSQVYEGARDWLQDHQHEALEHMLGVAETLAVAAVVTTGATLVARGFQRSAFVDSLEPASLGSGRHRLWCNDLSPYRSRADGAELLADGSYGREGRRWIYDAADCFEIHRPDPQGPWRLRHPQRPDAFGPVVDFNGERCWRLRRARPLEWGDEARMLATLWPSATARSAEDARAIIQAARVDADELRGLLVGNRRLPVNLRDALRRFDADARTQRFFASLQEGRHAVQGDEVIQRWCMAQPTLAGLDADGLRQALVQQQAALRKALFDHLSEVGLPADDALLGQVRRDFPGLPPAYAAQAVAQASATQRLLASGEQRVPLAIAQGARSLLRLARLSRAVQGLFLANATCAETGELVLALLRRVPNWPSSINLLLRDGNGRQLAIMNPAGSAQACTELRVREGRVSLYDSQGRALEVEVEEPAGFCEAISALLSPAQLQSLLAAPGTATERLRQVLIGQLPASDTQLIRLLGWPTQARWVNPGQRLPDGRVGYLLSGRHPGGSRGAAPALSNSIRALYPSFDDAQVARHLRRLLLSSSSPMSALLQAQEAYQDLDTALNRWQGAELNESRSVLRGRLADRLRRVWRMEDNAISLTSEMPASVRLDFSGLALRTLPAFPSTVSFEPVTELVLTDVQINAVAPQFLQAFPRLRRLTLNRNQLLAIPPGVGYLVELQTLRLAHNQVRMNAQGLAVLSGLPNLEVLDLSDNPVGFVQLRFNQLSHLRELFLRHCNMTTWPFGLQLCGALQRVDLRDNQLMSLPDDIMMMPLSYRRAFLLERNPMPSRELVRLYSVQDYDRLHDIGEGDSVPEPQEGAGHWLTPLEPEQRLTLQAQWDTLRALPGSDSFFALLDELHSTADFVAHHTYLAGRVTWMVGVLAEDAPLRETVFERVSDSPTCADGLAERFSELMLQVEVARANRYGAAQERGARLIHLGRQLYRLGQVDRIARQVIAGRRQTGRDVDDLEVILFYRIQLAESLDLPLQPRSMRYESVADVSPSQLDEALKTVLAAETEQALVEYLVQQEFWRTYLQERHDRVFASVTQDFAARGEAIDEASEQLSSQEYTARWDALKSEREATLDALVMELTLEALVGVAPRHSVS
ncbi:NEL-type E3 ubiquitin ligase domain-containing protein [Pseudomonas sp. SC11]|uniref:NEL-type E3 ubiquitin ligase domain-containing protein n=1 Tax=Pseudomonas sp. SC11 TaxID=326927 RepID=UPI00399A478F